MQIASQLKGLNHQTSNIQRSIKREAGQLVNLLTPVGQLLLNKSGDLVLNYQARFNTGAVWRGMPCAELHWGLVGDRSVAAGSVWLLPAMLGSCGCMVRPCPDDGTGQGQAQRGDANPDKCLPCLGVCN